MRTKTRRREGLTLVEVALLLSILGIVVAVSVPTFVRALRTSKMAEAPLELERIYRATAAYYETPQQTAAGLRMHCMPDAAGPTPSKPRATPVPVVFGAGDAPATWRAIGYEPAGPIRYRYTFLPARSGCGVLPADSHGEPVLTLRAEGDLDGDGVLSLYERTAVTKDGALSSSRCWACATASSRTRHARPDARVQTRAREPLSRSASGPASALGRPRSAP